MARPEHVKVGGEPSSDLDEIIDVATALGRDLVLPEETIINGIRYDAGVYRASLTFVAYLVPKMDDPPF